jgi:E3 ubiquitin-protein ligase HECTD1
MVQVRTMVCGDQAPVFTREEILKFTEPKLGYTKDSPGFLRYLGNFLASAKNEEVRAFY